MKMWAIIVGLLTIAVAAALGWHNLALDPGYVLIQLRGTTVETSLIFVLVALAIGLILLTMAIRLLRWPLSAWSKRARRRNRKRLTQGLMALIEGHYQRAIRDLSRVSPNSSLKAPALLALAGAAQAQGDYEHALTTLDRVIEEAPKTTIGLRARFLLAQEKPLEALSVLKDYSTKGKLSPLALQLLIESALLMGDHASALSALHELQRSKTLASPAMNALEIRVISAVLLNTADVSSLNTFWDSLSHTQRRVPDILVTYARRAAALNQTLASMSELEAGLRKQWSESLVRCYGELGTGEASMRLRNAESWLKSHPNSPALLLTLGRLCRDEELWGKAHHYLEQVLALEETPEVWETLGDCYEGQNDTNNAALCYRNALQVARSQPSQTLEDVANRKPLHTIAATSEERSEHGVPRLPDSAKPPFPEEALNKSKT